MGTEVSPVSALYPSAAAPVEAGAVDSSPRLPADVRKVEPPPSGTSDYNAVMPLPKGATAQNSPEVELAKKAMHSVGIGVTMAAAAYSMALHAHRHGPYKITDDEAMAQLRDFYGDEADEKIALARGLYADMAKTWPGMQAWLEQTRLGSWPPFIRLMIERAEAR